MDIHLNLFRFFHESEDKVLIENNLSRAFALCLRYDPLFFSQYLQGLMSPEDYDYLFGVWLQDAGYEINLQQNMSDINVEGIKKVYAVAMITQHLDMADFWNQQPIEGQFRHTTDVWIQIKDIAVVIEVKKTAEDCKRQLFNQVQAFLQTSQSPEVIPVSRSWMQVIHHMEKVVNLHKLHSGNCMLIEDFLLISKRQYPEWFPSKPFRYLSFSANPATAEYKLLEKRLHQSIVYTSFEEAAYSDRFAVAAGFKWANEIQLAFQKYDEAIQEYLVLYIWPGNTKGQGRFIYDRPMDWLRKTTLTANGKPYELEIAFNIKISHFNRFVTGLTFYEGDLKGPMMHTTDNYHEYSGRWQREQWPSFEAFMDEYFKEEFSWRDKCEWEDHLIDSDRSYFTCSLGFEIALFIPFAELVEIDRINEDARTVGNRLNEWFNAIGMLIH